MKTREYDFIMDQKRAKTNTHCKIFLSHSLEFVEEKIHAVNCGIYGLFVYGPTPGPVTCIRERPLRPSFSGLYEPTTFVVTLSKVMKQRLPSKTTLHY